MHLLPAAGPRNPPMRSSARLVVVAWLQLLLVLAASVWLGMLVWMVSSPGFAWYVCEEQGPNCVADQPTTADIVSLAAIQSVGVLGVIAAVVVARRHDRGRARRRTVVAALALSFALFVGIEVLLWHA